MAGSIWVYENILDPWAWCDGADDCAPVQGEGQRATFYDHTFKYSTRPRGQRKGGKDDRGQKQKCADTQIQNPLSEPAKTSGGFVRGSIEATYDRNGKPLRTVSFEQLTGPQVEFDDSYFQVVVEQNVVNLQLSTIAAMKDTVCDRTLWDLPKRCWKLSEFKWERKLYGTCGFYYTRTFTFEGKTTPERSVNGQKTGVLLSGWDRLVPEMSSKALNGHWNRNVGAGLGVRWVVDNFLDGTVPNKDAPTHYDVIPAPKGGGNIRAYLSQSTPGTPATDEADIHKLSIQYYDESNFLTLGIPTVL